MLLEKNSCKQNWCGKTKKNGLKKLLWKKQKIGIKKGILNFDWLNTNWQFLRPIKFSNIISANHSLWLMSINKI